MARDPKRIDEVLNRLKRLWNTYPDFRFCQMLVCIVGVDQDPFYLEDEDLMTAIEDYQKQVSGKV
jgi:uncharacterized protein YihD (DUF1040 family)